MESGKRVRPSKTLVLCGILGAVLLAQGATSLRCYSCRDSNNGGCATDRIKIEECAPPRNVCLEVIHVVTLDNQTLSAALKGCDVGTHQNVQSESGSSNSSSRRSRIHACSEDLCNTLVTGDFIKRPDNGSKPSVPRDNNCYSCLSTSEYQCSATKAALVQCHGDEEVCYNESSTITLGNLQAFTVPYFMKKCSDAFCVRTSTRGEFLQDNVIGTCCKGNLCNGVRPPNTSPGPPNTGLRPTTCFSHLIMAAILAITRM